MSKLLDPGGTRAVVVKADQGLALGPVQGLEDMGVGLRDLVSSEVDGVLLSPGEAGRHIGLFKGKRAPALLIRSDWSNAARGSDFPLPRESITRARVAGARHGAFLGAHALVATFFVGHKEDQDEADNLEAVSHLAAECLEYGLPLIVEAIPLGERITDHNYQDSIKMAGRMSLEAGADGIIVPYGGSPSIMEEIVDSSGDAPVLLLLEKGLDEAAIAASPGAKGVVLGGWVMEGPLGDNIQRTRAALAGVEPE